MKYIFLFLVLAGLAACEPQSGYTPDSIMAYVPVYASPQNVNTIATEPAKPTTRAGKIYAYGSYLFQVEQNEGIHIIDNSVPAQAHKIAFLKIPMCTELSIKSGYLYTNNMNDLVVFNISNISAPQLVSRLEDAFPAIDQDHPPFTNTYFECPDPSKGVVVAWERRTVNQPKCRR